MGCFSFLNVSIVCKYLQMNESGKISVLLADDHSFFRKGLFELLVQTGRYNMVGQAASGDELVKLAVELEPDIAIVDISMPRSNGIDATRAICERGLKTAVLAFSYYDEDYIIIKMMKAGAMGFLNKNTDFENIVDAIDTIVVKKEIYFHVNHRERMMNYYAIKHRGEPKENNVKFSNRELEIIHLVCKEYTNAKIADELSLSKRTIETHRARVMKKMGVATLVGLVIYAYSNGLISIDNS